MLVPVLPFLVREMGYSRFAYGVLQSSMWMSQTILSPLLGALSDNLGRRAVIFVSLLISASGARQRQSGRKALCVCVFDCALHHEIGRAHV